MGLKATYPNLEAVPEAQRTFYVKQADGSYALDAEDVIPKAKHEEFRTNNRALNSKVEELEAALKKAKEEVDPEEYARLKAGKQQAASAEIEEERRKAKKKEEELSAQNKALEQSLHRRILEAELSRQAVTLGVREKALPDFLERGRKAFKVVVNDKGEEKVVSAAADGITPDEWGKELRKDADHLFGENAGGGAKGNNNGKGGAGRITLTARQAARPTPEQVDAMAKGLVDYTD